MASFRTTEAGESLIDIYRGTDSEVPMNLNKRSRQTGLEGEWGLGGRWGGRGKWVEAQESYYLSPLLHKAYLTKLALWEEEQQGQRGI